MDLYLNTYGSYLHKVGDMFEVKVEDKKSKISPNKIKSIVMTTGAHISTDAIALAVKNNIDIVILDDFGDVTGRFWHSKFGSTAYIRRKQIEIFEGESALKYAKYFLNKKLISSIKHLKDLKHNRPSRHDYLDFKIKEIDYYSEKINNVFGSIDEQRNLLMSYEGNASKIYYEAIEKLIPKEFVFKGRSFRPAEDEYNCLLNYGFGILYNKVEKSLIIAGLDPFVGILHVDGYNRKSLVFDIIEIFRCYVWEVVLKLFSQKKINKGFFDKIYGGYKLNKDGKKILAQELSEYMSDKIEFDGRHLERSAVIQSYCHKLANSLIGEKDAGIFSL